MASNFSHIIVEIMQMGVSQLKGDGKGLFILRSSLGCVTYADLHHLTLIHPYILYNCGSQYMSCSFHCISGKDFSLLKNNKKVIN